MLNIIMVNVQDIKTPNPLWNVFLYSTTCLLTP